MEATLTATRREIVVRAFFWALLVAVSLMTAYFTITGGPTKQADKSHGTANVQQLIAQYKAALANNPKDVDTLIGLGDLYLNSNNVRDAYQTLLTAQKVAPDNTHILNDLGSIYLKINRYDQALASYEEAYRIDPSHGSSLLSVAMIYSRYKGDKNKALQLLEEFLAGNPEPQLAADAKQEIARIRQEVQQSGK